MSVGLGLNGVGGMDCSTVREEKDPFARYREVPQPPVGLSGRPVSIRENQMMRGSVALIEVIAEDALIKFVGYFLKFKPLTFFLALPIGKMGAWTTSSLKLRRGESFTVDEVLSGLEKMGFDEAKIRSVFFREVRINHREWESHCLRGKLELGASEVEGLTGYTALHEAVERGCLRAVQLLQKVLSKEEFVELAKRKVMGGRTVTHMACRGGNLEILKLLVKACLKTVTVQLVRSRTTGVLSLLTGDEAREAKLVKNKSTGEMLLQVNGELSRVLLVDESKKGMLQLTIAANLVEEQLHTRCSANYTPIDELYRVGHEDVGGYLRKKFPSTRKLEKRAVHLRKKEISSEKRMQAREDEALAYFRFASTMPPPLVRSGGHPNLQVLARGKNEQ